MDIDKPVEKRFTRGTLTFFERDEHAVIGFRRTDAVDARDGSDDDNVAALEERTRGAHTQLVQFVVDGGFFVDVDVGGGNVRFGLIEIVVADEIFDGVFGEKRFELVIELRSERFIVRKNESGPVAGFNQLGDGESFSGARDAEEHLMLLPTLNAASKLLDGRGLVTAWLIVAAQLEVHGRGLPARISGTAETLIILHDANRRGFDQRRPRVRDGRRGCRRATSLAHGSLRQSCNERGSNHLFSRR